MNGMEPLDDERYVPRNEIAAFFKLLHTEIAGVRDQLEKTHEATQSSLNRIERQTTETNGRVRELENWRASWRGIRLALMGISTAITGTVVAALAHWIGT